MDKKSQNEIVKDAKGLAKWFSVDIVIKVFGVVIWEYHFPPKEINP